MPEVNAVVVESKRPEVPPCPEMWVVQSFQFGRGWETEKGAYSARPPAHTFKPTRIIRIPAERPHADEREGDGVEELCKAIEQADRFKGDGFDTLASAEWDHILRCAAAVREARRAK